MTNPPTTPDGRYLVVRGRLWRAANPNLSEEEHTRFVGELMVARREVKAARRASDETRLEKARAQVDAAKVSLGERGPVWWKDGDCDFNRYFVKNTPYAEWYSSLPDF